MSYCCVMTLWRKSQDEMRKSNLNEFFNENDKNPPQKISSEISNSLPDPVNSLLISFCSSFSFFVFNEMKMDRKVLDLMHFLQCTVILFWIVLFIKFRVSEKATKIWKNPLLSEHQNNWKIFFQILWPSWL